MPTAQAHPPAVSIVVPIYNEAENLPDLVERIAQAMATQRERMVGMIRLIAEVVRIIRTCSPGSSWADRPARLATRSRRNAWRREGTPESFPRFLASAHCPKPPQPF